jgi:HNH endonuclease
MDDLPVIHLCLFGCGLVVNSAPTRQSGLVPHIERQKPSGGGKFVLVTWFIKLSLNDLQCLERETMCTVTRGCVVEVAHIYPVSLGSQISRTDQFSIWNILQHFWGEQRVARWLEALGGTTERLLNLICFAPTVDKCHQKELFALQPITPPPTRNY